MTLEIPLLSTGDSDAAATLVDRLATGLSKHEAEITEREELAFDFAFPLLGRPADRTACSLLEFGHLSVEGIEHTRLCFTFTPRLLVTWGPFLFGVFASYGITHMGTTPMPALRAVLVGALITGFYWAPIYLMTRIKVRRYLNAMLAGDRARDAT